MEYYKSKCQECDHVWYWTGYKTYYTPGSKEYNEAKGKNCPRCKKPAGKDELDMDSPQAQGLNAALGSAVSSLFGTKKSAPEKAPESPLVEPEPKEDRVDPRLYCMRKECNFEGPASMFEMAVNVHHDFCCPKCGTTNIDTSELNIAWEARGEAYGYGDRNTMIFRRGPA